jgi:trehalose 6-phosphate synthase/phosphatase
LVTKVANHPATEVVLMSGRSKNELARWFEGIPICLAAEHGAIIRRKGSHTWHKTSSVSSRWKKTVLPILNQFAEKTPGAFVEEKEWSLVWHYRRAQPYYAQKNLVQLKRLFKHLSKDSGLTAQSGNKILEIRPTDISKGHAVQQWLKAKPDFVVALGDDFTDEDTFAALPDHAYSIKVGRGRTAARFRITSVDEVRKLLKSLSV